MKPQIEWNDFEKIDLRVGTILEASLNTKAHKPAYILQVDFGEEIGIKKTSAQLTERYSVEDLIAKQVVAVLNFPPKQIANMKSECLILGAVDQKDVTLLTPLSNVPNGLKIG